MRKKDIQLVDDEGRPLIYAVGSQSPLKPVVWTDPKKWGGGNYHQFIPWEVSEGAVLGLESRAYPGSPWAKKNVVPAEEAIKYTIEDFQERLRVARSFSGAGQSVANKRWDALGELKKVPDGWDIQNIRMANIRYFWAEYVEELDSRVRAGEEAAKAEQAERELKQQNTERVIKQLHQIAKDNEINPVVLHSHGASSIVADTQTVAKFLELAGFSDE